MPARSFAQIVWRRQRLGLEVVNPGLQSDFLFADVLRQVCKAPGSLKLVKHRDRRPERAIGYHPGEVWARYDATGDTAKVTVYLWPLVQKKALDPETGEPIDCIAHQYLFPLKEFLTFIQVMNDMLDQRDQFDALQLSFATTPRELFLE